MRLLRQPRGCCANPVLVAATDQRLHPLPLPNRPFIGGTGREGVRSEERAEQRLAPGGGAPCPGAPKGSKRRDGRSPLPRSGESYKPQPLHRKTYCPGKATAEEQLYRSDSQSLRVGAPRRLALVAARD